MNLFFFPILWIHLEPVSSSGCWRFFTTCIQRSDWQGWMVWFNFSIFLWQVISLMLVTSCCSVPGWHIISASCFVVLFWWHTTLVLMRIFFILLVSTFVFGCLCLYVLLSLCVFTCILNNAYVLYGGKHSPVVGFCKFSMLIVVSISGYKLWVDLLLVQHRSLRLLHLPFQIIFYNLWFVIFCIYDGKWVLYLASGACSEWQMEIYICLYLLCVLKVGTIGRCPEVVINY